MHVFVANKSQGKGGTSGKYLLSVQTFYRQNRQLDRIARYPLGAGLKQISNRPKLLKQTRTDLE
jgi:hypothetical protein